VKDKPEQNSVNKEVKYLCREQHLALMDLISAQGTIPKKHCRRREREKKRQQQ